MKIKTIISAMATITCAASVVTVIWITVSAPSRNMQTLLPLMILGAFGSAAIAACSWPRKENKNICILVSVAKYNEKIGELVYDLEEIGYDVRAYFTTDVEKINEIAPNFVITDQFINYDQSKDSATLKIKDDEIKSPVIFILKEGVEDIETSNLAYIHTTSPIHVKGMISVIEDIIPIAA